MSLENQYDEDNAIKSYRPQLASPAPGSSPIDPNDGVSGLSNAFTPNSISSGYRHASISAGSLPSQYSISPNNSGNAGYSSEEWERRPSFLGLGGLFIGSSLRHSRENDRLINYIEKSQRSEAVRELRTQKLIGSIGQLFNWGDSFKSDDELNKLKNKQLREFYIEQNELIEKYQEIDKLLDSGIHHTMITNYSERNDNGRNGNTNEHTIDESTPMLPSNSYGSTNSNGTKSPPNLHRRTSAVPGNVDLETGNLLGYNKSDELQLVKFAIKVNFIANVVLLLGKTIVALLTSSISILASLIDSILDFLSTLIIYFSNKFAQSKDSKSYPIGRNRLEPIGVLVFSVIIVISFGQVGIEAFNRLLYGGDEIIEIGLNSVLIMLLTIFVKLGCYLWGKTIKSSSAEALAQDALVDVIFNTFSILMPVLGYYFKIPWFDALGALLLSIYIIYLWSITCIEHIIHLTGHEASPEEYKVILYLCSRFAEKINKIKNLRCYHVGDCINVEVDLVIDSDKMNIRDSHDLAEALQYTLEALPLVNIERAFVHIDYEVDNFKGHLRG